MRRYYFKEYKSEEFYILGNKTKSVKLFINYYVINTINIPFISYFIIDFQIVTELVCPPLFKRHILASPFRYGMFLY